MKWSDELFRKEGVCRNKRKNIKELLQINASLHDTLFQWYKMRLLFT